MAGDGNTRPSGWCRCPLRADSLGSSSCSAGGCSVRSLGRIAAAVFWLYPSLIFFNFTILTETLFTFLLVAFVCLAVQLVEAPRA